MVRRHPWGWVVCRWSDNGVVGVGVVMVVWCVEVWCGCSDGGGVKVPCADDDGVCVCVRARARVCVVIVSV